MSQRLIITLIPLQVFAVCLLAGWLAVMGVLALIADAPIIVREAAPAAGQVAAGPQTTGPAGGPVLSSVFTPEVQFWSDQIVAWSATYKLDPNLVATVMQIESCGAPSVVSPAGAQGLFQVMPFHFAPGESMQDPDTNAARGLDYLSLGLQRSGGNAGLALAGYNGGHSQIGKASSLWPRETQRYYHWGTGIYEAATTGQASSERLQEWLQAGGASLCAKAAQQLALP
jgi:soluble lytic murein transglycosylase-like protein